MNIQKSPLITRFTMVALALVVLVSLLGVSVRPAAASPEGQPAAADPAGITIVSVSQGKSVTIKVASMPASKEFRVLMNEIGTKGVGGTVAGTARTNSEGAFTATFNIPSKLKDLGTIAIRIEATDKTGWYAYNWFYNRTSGSTSGSSSGGSGNIPAGSTGSKNVTVVSVVEDVSVSIKAQRAPANTTLGVWVDRKNRQGTLFAYRVGSVTSDKNGAVSATFKLPAAVQDRSELRIRLQTLSGASYVAYAWFLNGTSDENTGSGAPDDYTGGIPYIVVTEVVKNESVTIEAHNFPKGDFKALLGRIGTKGENGSNVGTVKIKTKGVVTASFDIPKSFKDRTKIVIRFQGIDDSDFYAYTWFYNTTSSGQ